MEVNARILRHKPTGILYAYQAAFALREDFEEVLPPATEASEMFAAPKAKPPRGKRAAEPLTASEAVARDAAEAIGLDASRNLP